MAASSFAFKNILSAINVAFIEYQPNKNSNACKHFVGLKYNFNMGTGTGCDRKRHANYLKGLFLTPGLKTMA